MNIRSTHSKKQLLLLLLLLQQKSQKEKIPKDLLLLLLLLQLFRRSKLASKPNSPTKPDRWRKQRRKKLKQDISLENPWDWKTQFLFMLFSLLALRGCTDSVFEEEKTIWNSKRKKRVGEKKIFISARDIKCQSESYLLACLLALVTYEFWEKWQQGRDSIWISVEDLTGRNTQQHQPDKNLYIKATL